VGVSRRLLLFPERVSLGDTSAVETSKHILSQDPPHTLNSDFLDFKFTWQNEKTYMLKFQTFIINADLLGRQNNGPQRWQHSNFQTCENVILQEGLFTCD
jgi:hypothetical protein